LAKAVNYSASLVSAVELGQQRPSGDFLARVDKVLDTGGLFARMLDELVSLDLIQSWQRDWQAVIEQAKALRWYQSSHIPGPLQTEDYARAVFESGDLFDPDEVDSRLANRMKQQDILDRDRPPGLVVVLDEALLRRPVGGTRVMREQLLHLIRLAEEHHRVRLHIVPQRAGEYPGLSGPIILATMEDGSESAFLSGHLGGRELARPAELRWLQRVWETILAVALPPRESLELIREVAESWS
jgi:transcriptional regulator with XRE-family HTH domain